MKKRHLLLISTIVFGVMFYYKYSRNSSIVQNPIDNKIISKKIATKGGEISPKSNLPTKNIEANQLPDKKNSNISLVEAKELLKSCIDKRKKLEEEWKAIEKNILAENNFKLTEYELNIMNHTFEETQCNLTALKSLKENLSKKIISHLERGDYLKAVKLETAFQKETSTLSGLNWEVLKGITKVLENKNLGQYERSQLEKNIVRVVDTTISWKMEHFERAMTVKLLKLVSNNKSDKSWSLEIRELDEKVKSLDGKLLKNFEEQGSFIDRDMKKLKENGQAEDIDEILRSHGKNFSKSYLPIYKESLTFQNNRLIPFINKLKSKIL